MLLSLGKDDLDKVLETFPYARMRIEHSVAERQRDLAQKLTEKRDGGRASFRGSSAARDDASPLRKAFSRGMLVNRLTLRGSQRGEDSPASSRNGSRHGSGRDSPILSRTSLESDSPGGSGGAAPARVGGGRRPSCLGKIIASSGCGARIAPEGGTRSASPGRPRPEACSRRRVSIEAAQGDGLLRTQPDAAVPEAGAQQVANATDSREERTGSPTKPAPRGRDRRPSIEGSSHLCAMNQAAAMHAAKLAQQRSSDNDDDNASGTVSPGAVGGESTLVSIRRASRTEPQDSRDSDSMVHNAAIAAAGGADSASPSPCGMKADDSSKEPTPPGERKSASTVSNVPGPTAVRVPDDDTPVTSFRRSRARSQDELQLAASACQAAHAAHATQAAQGADKGPTGVSGFFRRRRSSTTGSLAALAADGPGNSRRNSLRSDSPTPSDGSRETNPRLSQRPKKRFSMRRGSTSEGAAAGGTSTKSSSAANGSILAQMAGRRSSHVEGLSPTLGGVTGAGTSLADIASLVQASGERTRNDIRTEIERAVRKLDGSFDTKFKAMQRDLSQLQGSVRDIKMNVSPNWLGQG